MRQRIRVSSCLYWWYGRRSISHQRSLEAKDQTQLEEERRLMYVGVTRAEEKLYLTHARRRKVFGQSEFSIASRF